MPSSKQSLKEVLKHLSTKEKREALKWIDSLLDEEIKKLELLTKIQLVQVLTERFLKRKD